MVMIRGIDKSVGIGIFVASILGFIAYAWLLLASQWGIMVLQFTALAAVAGLLGVLAWIGYAMATTPAPPSVEHDQQSVPETEKDEMQQMEPALSKE